MIGREFNITRDRIKQIKAKALRKLRHPSRRYKFALPRIVLNQPSNGYSKLFTAIFGKEEMTENQQNYLGVNESNAIQLGKSNYIIYNDLCTHVDMLDIPHDELELWTKLGCKTVYDIFTCKYYGDIVCKDTICVYVEYLYNTLRYLNKQGYTIPNAKLIDVDELDYSKAIVAFDELTQQITKDTPIEMLVGMNSLSLRIINCLRRSGIETVGDIVNRHIEDVTKIRNLGKKGFEELQTVLTSIGLSFREDEQ